MNKEDYNGIKSTLSGFSEQEIELLQNYSGEELVEFANGLNNFINNLRSKYNKYIFHRGLINALKYLENTWDNYLKDDKVNSIDKIENEYYKHYELILNNNPRISPYNQLKIYYGTTDYRPGIYLLLGIDEVVNSYRSKHSKKFLTSIIINHLIDPDKWKNLDNPYIVNGYIDIDDNYKVKLVDFNGSPYRWYWTIVDAK